MNQFTAFHLFRISWRKYIRIDNLRIDNLINQTITISDEDDQDNQREKTRQELDGGEHHTARNRWTNRSESSYVD